MKFNSNILNKAWAIYRNIKTVNPEMSHRKAWSLALKEVYQFLKGMIKGVISFFKLPKVKGGEVEVTTRRIAPISLMGYPTEWGEGSIFKVLDMDKVDSGENHCIISFHNFQMV